VSLTIEPGEVVALVGPSGGGKSTSVGLIEHFYEPTEGAVLLDGVPVQEYSHSYLHSKVSGLQKSFCAANNCEWFNVQVDSNVFIR
jgi:ABC-type multidrug transport system fused ATPase/permease subunit